MKKNRALMPLFYLSLIVNLLLLMGCSSTIKEESLPPVSELEKVEVQPPLTEAVLDEDPAEDAEPPTASQEMAFHFIDTGNSDAVLLESNGHFALIDAGDRDDDQTVQAYLTKQGVQTLDYLILTHYHADHIGAADTVLRQFEVLKTLVPNGDADTQVYRDFILALSDQGLKASVPLEGVELPLGEATLTFYNTKGGESNENNNSLVTLVEHGSVRALFTGDAERQVESTLNIGKIDLMKVGHHGSKTSNSRDFIQQLQPDYAVVMVGQPNKYNHPSREAMQVFESLNIPIYRTDEQGNILFTSNGEIVSTTFEPGSYQGGEEIESETTESSTLLTPLNPEETLTQTPEPEVAPVKESYQNCTLLREVYPSGVPEGHPAYESKHDRDKDGWACEK